MPVKEVLMIGNPELRQKSSDIIEMGKEVKDISLDLKDTLEFLQKTKNIGRGLAAPQIGYLKKIIYFGLPSESFIMINPKILYKSEETFQVWDSCFSFDVAFFVEIKRHKSIVVEYMNQIGEKTVRTFDNDLSELIQHEIDHLEGILATDHLTDVKKIISRQEWENRYRDIG